MLSLCKRRGFLWPAYEIYGGVAGMYDYGPLGVKLKNNVIDIWRKAYTLGEGFIEIDGDTVVPEAVFKASGHVDEFSDAIVYCTACDESFRADHLLEEYHPNSDALSVEEMDDMIREHGITCLECGGGLDCVTDFNLMFKTNIGPRSGRTGYLRPETAQNIFVDYIPLYRYMREKLPFGVIQIGKGYRNEISPRQGMIRLREFNMMEAELFVDPEDKSWSKFKEIADQKIKLVPDKEEEMEITLKEAVDRGIVAHETIAYYLWFTQEFLKAVGVDPDRLRFRQHLSDEMAHYAADCWDAEALLSYGWTELVGIADRGCWDLSQHIEHSNADMRAFKPFDEPKEVERTVIKPRYDLLGPEFKGKAGEIGEALEGMDPDSLEDGEAVLSIDGEEIVIDPEYFEIENVKEKVAGERIVPHVIEPSHGLDRIIYTILEHAVVTDEDDYTVLKLKPNVAPTKVGVFPLMAKDDLDTKAKVIDEKLRLSGIDSFYDDSGSIGRRYARMDEIGTPWCITVDYQTLEDSTVTIRDRDTNEQIRIPSKKVASIVNLLLCGADFDEIEEST